MNSTSHECQVGVEAFVRFDDVANTGGQLGTSFTRRAGEAAYLGIKRRFLRLGHPFRLCIVTHH
jgi:hypothetical protein